jgi:hypothetical protein
VISLKELDGKISWISFSQKTLKLWGITSNYQTFSVVFDENLSQGRIEFGKQI